MRTRLFRSTVAKIRIGDFVAESVINGSTAFAGYRGVVESIVHIGGIFDSRDIYFTNGTGCTLDADDRVWIEREYI